MKAHRDIVICVVLLSTTASVLADISEKEYRARYAFGADPSPLTFQVHPDGRYRVFAEVGVRECDLEGGDHRVLAFYDRDKLIRSYSLAQLFPNREVWDFDKASGVFLWLVFNPRLNGFHGENYTMVTVSGVFTFHVASGNAIEPEAEHDPVVGRLNGASVR